MLYSWGWSWRSGTRCGCKTDSLWVRSPLGEMKYLLEFIFPFLRSGVEAKRGVDFCHLTRNASRIRQKMGNRKSYTRFPLPTLLCAGYSVKLIKKTKIYVIYASITNNQRTRVTATTILFLYVYMHVLYIHVDSVKRS